ncbi:MAG: DNA recombination protein RmuC [Gemmatimonadales bacterium]
MTVAVLALLLVVVVLLVVLLLRRPADGSAMLQQQLIEVRGRLDALVGSQGSAVGDVRERLGRLAEATKRMEEVGARVAEVQELLKVPRLRGTLGETWLEELLRQIFPAGLYEMQHAFRSGERVDAVLKVGDRLVSVDAKFPLEACQRMLAAKGAAADAERRAFRKSLRARIDEIADKYIRPDEGTFEFALMYIPAENVYYEAVIRGEEREGGESLVAYALGRKVIPVSPNTFYAYLSAILHGLRGLEVEKQAQEILDSLGGLRQQFTRFEEAYRLVGKHLDHAARQYAETDKQLDRIQDRLEAITGVTAGDGFRVSGVRDGDSRAPDTQHPTPDT